jgi:hypothetical protein
MGKKQPIVIEQDAENPVPKKIIVQALIELHSAATNLLKSGIHRTDLVVLLRDRCNVNKDDISRVLVAIEQLGKDYAKKS